MGKEIAADNSSYVYNSLPEKIRVRSGIDQSEGDYIILNQVDKKPVRFYMTFMESGKVSLKHMIFILFWKIIPLK